MKLVNGDSMNEELKEILEGMQKANDEDKNLWLENTSVKLLYSYITNLQERKITKEDVDKYFEENMCVSFDKFIENWNEQENWTKYYRKENEELKSKNDILEFRMKQNDKMVICERYRILKQRDDYKQRIDKAIEYMNNTFDITDMKQFFEHLNNIEKILRGD